MFFWYRELFIPAGMILTSVQFNRACFAVFPSHVIMIMCANNMLEASFQLIHLKIYNIEGWETLSDKYTVDKHHIVVRCA